MTPMSETETHPRTTVSALASAGSLLRTLR